MYAQNLVVHQSREIEVVENFHTVLPRVRVAILAHALLVKTVNLFFPERGGTGGQTQPAVKQSDQGSDRQERQEKVGTRTKNYTSTPEYETRKVVLDRGIVKSIVFVFVFVTDVFQP